MRQAVTTVFPDGSSETKLPLDLDSLAVMMSSRSTMYGSKAVYAK
jgi:hypothetical protein